MNTDKMFQSFGDGPPQSLITTMLTYAVGLLVTYLPEDCKFVLIIQEDARRQVHYVSTADAKDTSRMAGKVLVDAVCLTDLAPLDFPDTPT